LETLPVIVERQSLKPAEVKQRMLISAIQREDLKPVEKARAIKSLMDEASWNATEIARHLGITSVAVSRSLALLALPPAILSQVEGGIIPAATAVELVRINDPVVQQELAAKAASGQLTRDGVATELKAKKKKAKGPRPAINRFVAVLGKTRSVTVVSESISWDSFLEMLDELISKAKKVRSNMELSTFARMLADQAKS
jgi:ParB family chromosome partitioning protein